MKTITTKTGTTKTITTKTGTMKTGILSAAAVALALGAAGTASAAHDRVPSPQVERYVYSLDPVQDASIPNSQATGWTAITVLPNGNVKVQVEATGLAPNLPHLMHLHDVLDGSSDCPDPTAGDVVTVLDGAPSYGPIQLGLEARTADDAGTISYSAQFPADTAIAGGGTLAEIAGSAQVVVHGIDFNGDGEYAIDAGDPFASLESSIVAGAPLELTAPVLCGGVPN